jgi:hypothetical protein
MVRAAEKISFVKAPRLLPFIDRSQQCYRPPGTVGLEFVDIKPVFTTNLFLEQS